MPNMFGGDQFHPAYNPSVMLAENQVLVDNDLYTIEEDGRVHLERVDGTGGYTGYLPSEVIELKEKLKGEQ